MTLRSPTSRQPQLRTLWLLWFLILRLTVQTSYQHSAHRLRHYRHRLTHTTRRMLTAAKKQRTRIPTMIDQTIVEPIANGRRPRRKRNPETGQLEEVSGGSYSARSDGEKNKRAPRIDAQIQEIDAGFTLIFQSSASLLMNFERFEWDGNHIAMNSPMVVKAICNKARQDSQFRGWCLTFVHSTGYGELVMACAIFALPMLVYHGLIPQRFFGSNDNADQGD